jgi:chromosome segregation ATPase
LIQQNENAREVIGKQEKRIEDLEAELSAEKENSASIGKSYETAKSEIASLKQSNEALNRAVSINEKTIELLRADNAKQRDKAKKANKEKWKARAGAARAVLFQLLR